MDRSKHPTAKLNVGEKNDKTRDLTGAPIRTYSINRQVNVAATTVALSALLAQLTFLLTTTFLFFVTSFFFLGQFIDDENRCFIFRSSTEKHSSTVGRAR